MDISKSFLKTAQQYNQLNQYIPKSQPESTKESTAKTQAKVLAEQLDEEVTSNNVENVAEENLETSEEKTKSAKNGMPVKQQEVSQYIKDMIESMAREKAKLFNTGCNEKCGEPKTILTVLERIYEDKDYSLDQYLEDVQELNLKGKEKKDLDTLYHMRNVEVDKYDECECEEKKRRAKLLGYELKEQYGCCNVKKDDKKDDKKEQNIDIAL